MKEIKFGKPSELNKLFIQEYYCSVCNQIPVREEFEKGENGIIKKLKISGLWIIETAIMGTNEIQEIAVCSSCLGKIQAKTNEIMKKGVSIKSKGNDAGEGKMS